MQKKEIVLTLGLLAEKRACKQGLYDFEKWYPSGSAPLTEVIRKIQELANTSTDYLKYVYYANWLLYRFPSTQEPLVLNELTEKVIIHNGDIDIKSSIDGNHIIIGNGDLNIAGGANLSGAAEIWAKNVIAKDKTIALDDFAKILARKTIDAQNIAAKDHAGIWAVTIDTINIAAKDYAAIWAHEINTQNIMYDDSARIHGYINLIQPSSNPQNVTQPAN